MKIQESEKKIDFICTLIYWGRLVYAQIFFWMKGILILFFSKLVGGHLVACIKRNFIKTLFFTVSKINLKNYQFYKNDLPKIFHFAQKALYSEIHEPTLLLHIPSIKSVEQLSVRRGMEYNCCLKVCVTSVLQMIPFLTIKLLN